MTRERTRDGRRETHATGADRLIAKLATRRGEPLSGGDVARMPAEARRRLLMRLGFLSGRASSAALRAALAGVESPAAQRTPEARGHDRDAGETRVPPLNEAGPLGDRKALERDEAERSTRAWAPGRPATGEPRDVVLPPVRVTRAEADEVRRLAERAGVSVSEWIRTRALSTA